MNTSYLNEANSYFQYPMEYLKGMGRIFYMINPKEAFENVEEVPNFYVQSWPYFFTFMLMEHIILKLEGKRGIRLNDGITSISNGLFLECGRLIWRGAESYLYTWVYNNYKVFDLPWDSTSTWLIAALGIDFGYYWMHRACHEIHILWAQHQVHHTSEDFNMGVGIRQSVLQGWVGILFYLPLALAIPPAQFVMHHQFSYMYMFWIHTEAIKSLGPLEYILNTPSHHRIHHGSNPYCLDVNYGGVLIIWDRIFGTFRAEKKTDKIIYGLIFNQPSFNPLVLQTFYTRINVANKFRSQRGWWNKFLAVVHRPSWAPGGYKRFKELDEDPIVHTRIKYDVILPKWCTAYLLTHYGLVLFGFYQLFLVHLGMSPLSVLLLVIYILASLTIFGMILDASSKAPYLEVFRCISMFILSKFLTSIIGFTISPPWQMFYLISAGFWLLFVFKTIEIKVEKKGL